MSGEGNSYTAEFWQYDSRLGRRWNVDPVVKEHESPYATFANNPIWFVDLDGRDTIFYSGKSAYDENAQMVLAVADKTISADGKDVHLYLHEKGSINIDGKNYIEVWSRYSISGHDSEAAQTDNKLVHGVWKAWKADFEDGQDVMNWTKKEVYDGANEGSLDIAYNLWLEENTNGTSNSLYLLNGKYANANEVGNFFIGYAFGLQGGYSLQRLRLFANVYGFIKGTGDDDVHEDYQKSLGYLMGARKRKKKLNKKQSTNGKSTTPRKNSTKQKR